MAKRGTDKGEDLKKNSWRRLKYWIKRNELRGSD
jgi:hypothetical protein